MGGIQGFELEVILLVCVSHADDVANDGAQLLRCGLLKEQHTNIQGSTNTYLD